MHQFDPNFPSQQEYQQASQELQTAAPAPQGVMQNLARGAGKYGPDVAASLPVFGVASKLISSPALAAGVAGGLYEGGEKALSGGTPLEVAKTGIGSGIANAATVGLAQGAGSLISKIPGSLEKAGAYQINNMLKPLGKMLAFGKNPGRGAVAEGIIAKDYPDLLSQAQDRLNIRGQQIGDVLAQSDKKVSISDSLNPINEALAKAEKNPETNAGLISRLNAVKNDFLGIKKNSLGKETSRRALDGISVKDASDFKMNLGDLVKWTQNGTDDEVVNGALKKSYGIVKDKIGEAVPEIKPLNERYADLLSLRHAAQRQETKEMSRGFGLLGLGGGAQVLAGLAGHPGLIGSGLATMGAEYAGRSPLVRTGLAQGLYKTGNFLQPGLKAAGQMMSDTAANSLAQDIANQIVQGQSNK